VESQAVSVDGLLEAADPVWDADDVRPEGSGVHVRGRLSAAGHGRFFFSGTIEGAAQGTCRRCLTEVPLKVAEDVQVLFATSGLDEADEDDVVQIPATAWELDLRPAVREEWVLAVPAFALCREACLGLCPQCGADRNTGACRCAPSTDPRWDGLRATHAADT